MSIEYPLRYTPALVRRAAFAYCRRTVGLGYFVAVIGMAAAVSVLVWQGDRSWTVGFFGAFVVIGFVWPVAMFVAQSRQAFAKFGAMSTPEASLVVSDDGLEITSDLGRAKFPWASISAVWRSPNFWLLVFANSGFSTIPLESIPSDVQVFILESVARSGGKVQG